MREGTEERRGGNEEMKEGNESTRLGKEGVREEMNAEGLKEKGGKRWKDKEDKE